MHYVSSTVAQFRRITVGYVRGSCRRRFAPATQLPMTCANKWSSLHIYRPRPANSSDWDLVTMGKVKSRAGRFLLLSDTRQISDGHENPRKAHPVAQSTERRPTRNIWNRLVASCDLWDETIWRAIMMKEGFRHSDSESNILRHSQLYWQRRHFSWGILFSVSSILFQHKTFEFYFIQFTHRLIPVHHKWTSQPKRFAACRRSISPH